MSRLQEVVAHWMPRIQVTGISPGDANRIVAAAGEWANWLDAWSEEAERHLAAAEEQEAQRRLITAGESYVRAALCFHFGQFMFFDDLTRKWQAADRKVEAYRRAAPLLDPPAKAISVRYAGGTINGYLRLPAKLPAPLLLIIPGSDSTKEEFAALEPIYLARGLATFSFDGPGQGEARKDGPLAVEPWGPALRAVVDRLAGEKGLNGRIGIMGMAFGGHLAFHGAASVPELDAIVCMNGFHDLGGLWPSLPEIYRANMRFVLGGDDAAETAARAQTFTLARLAPPSCPALILHGGKDTIFLPAEARAIASYAGADAELVEFPDGNHVCNNIAYRYRPLIADWLAERLGGSTVSQARAAVPRVEGPVSP
jgi:dienelactone hydrolase